MNVEDFARMNRILNSYEPQIPGIKIINSKRKSRVVDEFRKDLEFFNSYGGYMEVARVLIYSECFVSIQLKDKGTPVIYYFTAFDDVNSKLDEIRKVSKEMSVPVEERDVNLI